MQGKELDGCDTPSGKAGVVAQFALFMDITKLRNITNDYRDVHLISLSNWKRAAEFEPRDSAGPYIISQLGFDPQDLQVTPTEFVLGKSGAWVRLTIFYALPGDIRRQEFVFGTAAEVMSLLGNLASKVRVIRSGEELNVPAEALVQDSLTAALLEAKSQ